MWCFRGCGDGGRQLPCMALSCLFLVVIFWPLFMATKVTARMLANVSRSVSSAVQESLLTDELTTIREIAKALNRNVDLLSNKWSWIKVGLLSFGGLFLIEILKIFTGVYTGVRTQYLVDRRRNAMLEDPLAASANQVAEPRAQQAAVLNRMVITADADREENQTNRDVDPLAAGLKSVEPNRRDNSPHWPRLETEASTEKGKEAVIDITTARASKTASRFPERLFGSLRHFLRRQVEMPA